MPRDVIPFRAGPNRAGAPAIRPNIAHAALDLFRRLARRLAAAVPFRDACRALECQSTAWGVPPTFFLTNETMGERAPTLPNWIADRFAIPVARRYPAGAAAWAALNDLLDDAFTGCAADAGIRRVARAVPGVRDGLNALAGDHRGCAELDALLDVADDFVVTVLHPSVGTGFRVRLNGIVDLDQLHVLLADAVAGAPARGYLAGARPDPRIVDAYLDQPADAESNIATARFQFFRSSALNGDGTLPAGFSGTDFWLWGHESPHAIPAAHGERVLLVADAVYPRQWIVRRRFPALNGGLELLNVLSREQVAVRIAKLTGRQTSEQNARRAA